MMPFAPAAEFSPPALGDLESIQELSRPIMQRFARIKALQPMVKQLLSELDTICAPLKKLESMDIENSDQFSTAQLAIQKLEELVTGMSRLWLQQSEFGERLKIDFRRGDMNAIRSRLNELVLLIDSLDELYERFEEWITNEMSYIEAYSVLCREVFAKVAALDDQTEQHTKE